MTGVYYAAVAFTAGVKYKVSFLFKKNGATAAIKWKIGTSASIAATELSGTPLVNYPLTELVKTRKQFTFTAKETANGYLTFFQSGTGLTNFAIDDVKIEEVKYTEIKVEAKLGFSETNLASDTAVMFSGFVGKKKKDLVYKEAADSVAFTVYTADDIAADISAQNLNAQYIDPDAAGVGNAGLFLPRIHGVYVVDAAISGYPLQAGAHTLSFTGGDLSLDDGTAVTLTAGSNILVNGDGTQKVEVYAYTSMLQTVDGEESIIVDIYGDTLPKNLMYGLSVKSLIKKSYELIGITETTWDELKIDSHDSTKRISFYDVPNIEASVTSGYYNGIASDGTDLWVSAGNKVYRKDGTTGEYELKVTLTTGYVVKRLLYNARNNHLWVLHDSATPVQNEYNKVRVYDITNDTLSNELTYSASEGNAAYTNSTEIIDYEYTSGSFVYGLAACAFGPFVFITKSGSSLSLTILSSFSVSEFALDVSIWQISNAVFFGLKDSLAGYVYQFSIDGSGAWVDDGILNIANPVHEDTDLRFATNGAYNYSDNKLYFLTSEIRSWEPGGSTASVLVSNITDAVLRTDGVDYVYGSCLDPADEPFYRLYSFSSDTATKITNKEEVKVLGGGISVYSESFLYGITSEGFVFQYATEINLYLNRKMASYADKTVRDLYSEALQAFNLVGMISANKTGMIYQRGGSDGTPRNSGNTLTIDVSDAEDIEESEEYFPAIDYVVINNGEVTISYDGMEFNTATPPNGLPLSINNEMIPTNIIMDVAKYIYEFFKEAKTLYRIPTAIVPLFQYEPFDAISLNFTDTKIQQTSSGPIYAFKYSMTNAMMTAEVLL